MKWIFLLTLCLLVTIQQMSEAQPLSGGHGIDCCDTDGVAGSFTCECLPARQESKQTGHYESRKIEGWNLNINRRLLESDPTAVDTAITVLRKQLKQIKRVVPAAAVVRLLEITLWMNPEYPGVRPTAEYHPGREWLVENGRNPDMAKGVEFTDIPIFAFEDTRMPCFVLHELAHSFHDRVLGFDRADIKTAYEHAKASKVYDKVERHNGEGRPNTTERAYAMVNEREYFAESTEAYFGTNDFYPFNRSQLKKVDPEIFGVLEKVWHGKQ